MRIRLSKWFNPPITGLPDAASQASSPEQPLRSELYSLDQLQRHARALAQRHHVAPRREADPLLPRLADNEGILQAYNEETMLVEKRRRVTPAAEWILDNFYLIEEQIKTVRRHLPRGYNRELPHLTTGSNAGFPRVYDLALELISHVDGRLDAEHLHGFVAAYQSVCPLKLGELWAIPIMLRLALLENLRRVTVILSADRRDRDLANEWTDRMTSTAESQPGKLIVVVARLAEAEVTLTRPFVAEFWRRIHGKTPLLQLPLSWLEQRLNAEGLTLEHLIQSESQSQASHQVSVGNSITSLRFLNAVDWRDFVEALSVVEKTLRTETSPVYAQMDFHSRDLYRHAVEDVARRSTFSEQEVAAIAVDLAREAGAGGATDRSAHVGHFLIGEGARQLERATRLRRSPAMLLQRWRERHALLFYVGGISSLTGLITVWLLERAAENEPSWILSLLALPVLMGVSQLAVGVVNWLVTIFVSARALPRLDFSKGIPAEYATLVVVPTLLTSASDVDDLLADMEIRYLANRDPNLQFALLTDFPDAPAEHLPEDDALLDRVRAGIEFLNRKYEGDRPSIFFLFHRSRRWNEAEGVWMGLERKRGKLADLNLLLRNRGQDCFSAVVGEVSNLSRFKYVITLDTDTQLPHDAARSLVGTMAHPLNRPYYDRALGRVTHGYGILQPRVEVGLAGAARSWFVRLFSGEPGLDPYTRVVSDVYQDLFQEGSFIGKGIYDVDAFEVATSGRFPNNRILSHDLLEGSYVRAGLISDVQLYEGMPATYRGDVARRHRWVRGDWQIASWLLPRVPGPDGRPVRNSISGLSRWKIFDNLRRSLVPVALTALLFLGWMHSSSPVDWALVVYAIVLLPVGMRIVRELGHKPEEAPWLLYLREVGRAAGVQLIQAVLTLAFLPYDAAVNLDAILRTIWRLGGSRRRLLEWQTARQGEQGPSLDLPSFYRKMAILPLLALALGLYLFWARSAALLEASPHLLLWCAGPALAWGISRLIPPRPTGLSRDDLSFLAGLARRTWRYFETFVSAEENWLPPDNFQEEPRRAVASRTSPTNIGMSLLANLAAADFGFISVGRLLERSDQTLTTMEKLEGHRGHFYNWYDTRTLKPLPPLYVSTVDSGNLAGNLLVLRPGLSELLEQSLVPPNLTAGLASTAGVLRSLWNEAGKASVEGVRAIEELLTPPVTSLSGAIEVLGRVIALVTELQLPPDESGEIAWWRQALERDAKDHRDDLLFLAPWTTLGKVPAGVVSPAVNEVLAALGNATTLRQLAGLVQTALPLLDQTSPDPRTAKEVRRWLSELRVACALGSERASQRIGRIDDLVQRCGELADMDFTFLYDPSRHLFSIGFNLASHRLDDSYYDLLASEARLASYVAISLGQVKQEHWFALGRLLTSSGAKPLLISWSGSMFEYLMPLLIMPSYEGTLLDSTYRAAIGRQIEYGKHRGVPWGLSESGYYLTDAHMNFQYRAFGVPGLGFKRGLADDIVVAPYASVMALMVEPEAACRNIQRMVRAGFSGAYGLYEAIDYTPTRLAPGQEHMLVSSFMAHHEGMSLLSLAYLLLDRPMQRRFQSNPLFKAAELLLQERVPKESCFLYPHEIEVTSSRQTIPPSEAIMRVFTNPGATLPEVHLLSNGRYHVMVSSAGCGYSRWKDLTLTRWWEDPTRDGVGTFLYVRDVESGQFWSAGFHPTLRQSKHYEAIFSQGRAEFRDRHSDLDMHTEICVSPEDDIEVRRLTISNRSREIRRIELTTYGEVVLAAASADAAHPAFSNLFVQTEIVRRGDAILCTRRPRSPEETPPWMFHLVLLTGTEDGEISFETDRFRFIGRGRSTVAPAAMRTDHLSNSQGSVLDPIVAIRRTARVGAEETIRFICITGAAGTREAAEQLMEKYHDAFLAERVIELAWTHGLVVLRQLNATEPEAQLYGRLASALLYMNRHRRAHPSVISRNRRGQSGLWSFGISGDLPILLLFSTSADRLSVVTELLQAHAYWRMKGLTVDLVIVIAEESGYRQSLYDSVIGLIASGLEAHMLDKPGGLFVRRVDQLSEEDRVLLQAAARVVLHDENGGLAEQLERPALPEPAIPSLSTTRPAVAEPEVLKLPPRELLFFNGLGGFTSDGREYVILLEPGRATPAPWVNVLANERFGTVVTDYGHAYTWMENSHEFRLTPWYNDPVTDLSGEAFYIRDEQTGQFWSPSPGPARGRTPYVVRHGFGYSVFEHQENGIASEMTVFVGLSAPVKFVQIKLRNVSARPRTVSVTGYWEWVLGDLRPKNMMHVQTEIDPRSGALFARNYYNSDFADRFAFVDCTDPRRTLTGSRTEFIGHNGTLANPAAMRRSRLSGRVGAGLDPCAAVQMVVPLAPGEEGEVFFRLGAARDAGEAQQLIHHFRGPGMTLQALEAVWQYWNVTLGQVHVETPDPAVNVLANGWLLYQTLACRIWARTGFYQSGGAYGFRDQLQDTMALVHADPRVLRQHLLRAARHQFREGDVQHWWHPPVGRGVRTHFSDDYLWLPYAACRYVRALNDTGVLDELIPFLEGRPVPSEVEAVYDLHRPSEETATLYEHCVRAIKRGFRWGEHGLPLIGCGDWNDGMNLVGAAGKGESVWLAFFLYDVLRQFAQLARVRGDATFADLCEAKAITLQENIEKHAWDGQWYRRAYFDNGEPLGSASNPECQIDALPQSWSVISKAGDPARSQMALEAVDKHLVRREARLIQLFDPPFDKSPLQPGYIKGYVPGVRENGGQYTHAAIWTIMAFALRGEHDRAWELLSLINPVEHGQTALGIQTYKVEPYVVAADVYAVSPHTGRGGWTWYTGSAGWLYRLLTETLLGLEKEGDVLRIHPRPRGDWPSYKIHYRFYETFYHITVARTTEASPGPRLIVDGQELPDAAIHLQNDRQHHAVELWF